MQSQIRDLSLSPQGQIKINWVKAHMPILNTLEKEFRQTKPFSGKKVAVCLHLEAKTAYMAQVIAAGGAEVAVCASNPLSTQDDVVAALVAGWYHRLCLAWRDGRRIHRAYSPISQI